VPQAVWNQWKGSEGNGGWDTISSVNLLAMDTCDARGSVAVLRDGELLSVVSHDSDQDYSVWLLPAVARALAASAMLLPQMDVYAVAAGPGSFTALRVGLTTVKGWSEVFGRPIAAVSRLAAMAAEVAGESRYVAAAVDAHREQFFAALYRREGGRLLRVEDEMVIGAEALLRFADKHAGPERISWVSLDPERLVEGGLWSGREKLGDTMRTVSPPLAEAIGRIGMRKALENELLDGLSLDANYVRRTDAELTWKGAKGHAG
jgi:tRNA threonylcarbamoyladenosine biosynthesis protein TsaB